MSEEWTDSRMREAFARLDGEPGEPVDPETLWAVMRGKADPDTVAEIVERLRDDPALREEWALAQSFADAAEREETETETGMNVVAPSVEPERGEPAPAANAGSYRTWLVVAGVAAAVLLAVLLTREDRVDYQDDPRQMRQGDAEGIKALVTGKVPRSAAVLRWSAVDDAKHYKLSVTTQALQPVFERAGLTSTELELPADSLASVPVGAKLLWRVEASMPDGTKRRSTTFTTELQ